MPLNLNKMILNKFLQLYDQASDQDQVLKIEKVIHYFTYAKAAYEIYQEFMQRWTQKEPDAERKFLVAILAMYANGKICLDITRDINAEITDTNLAKLRKAKKKWAMRFADFRDDVSAHPINNQSKDYFSYIASYGNFGSNMTVYLLDNKTLKSLKEYEIQPKADIEHLYDYLENLAEIYSKKWVKI